MNKRSLGLADTYMYINKINKDLLYSTGDYIQYFVITYNKKNVKKNILHHFAIHLKLIQHCISTILQFFKTGVNH